MEEEIELEHLIINHVNETKYKPVKPRMIAQRLELPKEQFRDVKKTVKRLVREGKLSYGANHLVLPAATQKPEVRQVVGTFRRAAGGYGFVRPRGATPGSRENDIYISANRTLDAADGDVVAVRLKRGSRRGDSDRQRGEIAEVLERDTHQFVGTYLEREGLGFVRVDGTVFVQPILVGDAGAKRAGEGDKVVIEMVRFPSHIHDGEGVIVEVLGKHGTPGVDTQLIMREFKLPESFPEEVLEVARQQAEDFDEAITDGRHDFTDMVVLTIDPKDARDFDDAISLERIENNHWKLGVHIADVSHFVRPGTLLDDEARQRATSVYLPDRVVPMLPEIISNNLASLQPKRVRFTKSVFIEFSEDGVPIDAEVFNGAIKSQHRFTYEEVDDYLADRENWKQKLSVDVFTLVGRMHELAMILRRRRLDGGAIELTLPEVKIDLDRDGHVRGAHTVENTESHQVIEEFMLAANEAVAQLLDKQDLFFLRRVHRPPVRRKLKDLTNFVRELGFDCGNLESRFEIKKVIEEVAGKPAAHAVNYAVLRSMTKACYSPEEEEHYALGTRHYCHFTSPIRRYPDLEIHRMFDALARGKRPPQNYDEMLLLGELCSDREQRAEKAERELIKIKLLNFLGHKIGEQLDAVITGVEDYGLFAQGVELPAEGLIRVQTMQDDYYDYDSKAHTLTGRRAGNCYRLGDLVRVEIAHVDVDRRQLDFRLVKSVEKRKPSKVARKKAKAKKKKTAKRGKTKKKRAKKRTKKRR